MVQQHEALHFRILFVNFCNIFGQRKARNGVRHISQALAIDFARLAFAVGLVGERESRGGVGVIDEFLRQECVQQRLDRRIGRKRIQ